jgi:WD40 repeat protein
MQLQLAESHDLESEIPPPLLAASGLFLAQPIDDPEPAIQIWCTRGLTSSTAPLATLGGHYHHVTALAFGNGGRDADLTLCSASLDTVLIWDLEAVLTAADPAQGCEVLVEDIGSEVLAMAFNVTNQAVALCVGVNVIVMERHTGRVLVRLEGHLAPVTAAAFNPHCAHQLVSISEDRTFKVWDLAKRGLFYQSAVLSAHPLLR